MLDTSARLLRLLSLLQSRHDWAGAELAARLDVGARTLRKDVERLRSLGYPVHGTRGVAGGYRLGAGAALPPLLLDDDEAVAVAIGLQTAAGGGVSGIEEPAVRALAKLGQVLPARLRHRLQTFQGATATVPGRGPQVDAELLTAIATAIRSSERLRFDYVGHGPPGQAGPQSRRDAEPHRLVCWGRRWYLVAWDVDRSDWRTFRVDRVSLRTPNGPRFTARDLPDEDIAAFVQQTVGTAVWAVRARVLVHAPIEYVRSRIPEAPTLEAVAADRCLVEVGSDHMGMLALYLGLLDRDFEVLDSPELVDELRRLAGRYTRIVDAATFSPPRPG